LLFDGHVLGGALAGIFVSAAWVYIQPLESMFTFLDVGSFLKMARILSKSLQHPVGVFAMLPHPPKCHILRKSKK
jgi:hypothetical protein